MSMLKFLYDFYSIFNNNKMKKIQVSVSALLSDGWKELNCVILVYLVLNSIKSCIKCTVKL